MRMPRRPDSLSSAAQARGLPEHRFGKAELRLGRTVTYFASKLKKKKNYGNTAIEAVLFFTITDKEFSPGGNNFAKKFDS